MIPNMLTIIRIILTPIIMILGFTGNFQSMVIAGVIAAITDFLDGYLARKWKVTSPLGAKLDMIADKVFAISLIGCLIGKEKILIIPFILEILIGCTNLYYYFKRKVSNSLMVGKIKTCALFSTVICGVVILIYKPLKQVFYGFTYATIHLQIFSLISYAISFFFPKHKPSINDNEMHKKIMEETNVEPELEKTIALENLEELVNEYNDEINKIKEDVDV